MIDTSALLAIVLRELGHLELLAKIASTSDAVLPAPAYLEAALKTDRPAARPFAERLDLVVERLALRLIPFTPDHAPLARAAHNRFGKGHHPAALNFGDCMVYAVAKLADAPLLYKGEDFARTDIRAAL